MLLVAAGLVVVFGQFRFAVGQHLPRHVHRGLASQGGPGRPDRRRAGGFGEARRAQSRQHRRRRVRRRRAATSCTPRPGPLVRYQNLVGDRYLEITSGPGDLRKLPAGATLGKENTAARAGPRRPARWAPPGAQGPRRQQGQRGQQRRHRTAAGPGWVVVDAARQHVVVHPEPRRSRPVDRRHHQQPQRGAGHGRREGRAVRRLRRPTPAAHHRAGAEPRSRSRAPFRRWRRPPTI